MPEMAWTTRICVARFYIRLRYAAPPASLAPRHRARQDNPNGSDWIYSASDDRVAPDASGWLRNGQLYRVWLSGSRSGMPYRLPEGADIRPGGCVPSAGAGTGHRM